MTVTICVTGYSARVGGKSLGVYPNEWEAIPELGDYEYRLSWECPSAACVMAHQDMPWEGLTADEWAALPWEWSYRIADGGDIHSQRHTLELWAEDHYQPVRNVRFERRVLPNPDEGWGEVAVRGATGVTHWKATSEGERDG